MGLDWRTFLSGRGEHLLFLPYLYHCVFVPAFILYLIRSHIREWFPERGLFVIVLLCLSLYALIVAPAKDIPPETQADLVRGPWFFLGLQSLLKIMPILVSGCILPGAFWGCLLILPVIAGRRGFKAMGFLEEIVYYGICGALVGYAGLDPQGRSVGTLRSEKEENYERTHKDRRRGHHQTARGCHC